MSVLDASFGVLPLFSRRGCGGQDPREPKGKGPRRPRQKGELCFTSHKLARARYQIPFPPNQRCSPLERTQPPNGTVQSPLPHELTKSRNDTVQIASAVPRIRSQIILRTHRGARDANRKLQTNGRGKRCFPPLTIHFSQFTIHPYASCGSRKPSSWRIRVGWRILRSAFASICRMRSRVTLN